jgi:predicted metal-binding membrane protein
MSVSTERPAGRDPGPVLWAVAGTGWVVIVASLFLPVGHLAHPGGALMGLSGEMGAISWPWILATFAGSWLVMVTAMMLPTTVPMARFFTVVSARQRARGPVRVVFFSAYFIIWLSFAAVALGCVLAIGPLLRNVHSDLVLAAALALAGAFQFSPLKKRCLTVCRDPAAFLFAHYRRGIGGAWSLGVRHAMSCVGCCWALMLVMFATGVGDLVWMLGLTVIMVAEKTTRWGARIGPWVGAGLLAAALLFAVNGGGSTATNPHSEMQMQMP